MIGGVGGLFALVLGHVFAAVGIGFLDRFTLFDYALAPSVGSALGALGLAVITCCLAALYPAIGGRTLVVGGAVTLRIDCPFSIWPFSRRR